VLGFVSCLPDVREGLQKRAFRAAGGISGTVSRGTNGEQTCAAADPGTLARDSDGHPFGGREWSIPRVDDSVYRREAPLLPVAVGDSPTRAQPRILRSKPNAVVVAPLPPPAYVCPRTSCCLPTIGQTRRSTGCAPLTASQETKRSMPARLVPPGLLAAQATALSQRPFPRRTVSLVAPLIPGVIRSSHLPAADVAARTSLTEARTPGAGRHEHWVDFAGESARAPGWSVTQAYRADAERCVRRRTAQRSYVPSPA
jgi:hypothetical protein